MAKVRYAAFERTAEISDSKENAIFVDIDTNTEVHSNRVFAD